MSIRFELSKKIIEKSLSLGFSKAGIVTAGALESESERLSEWLKRGYASEMKYMQNNKEKRTDPRLMIENCRSVIVVLLNYRQKDYNSFVSEYACGEDYHRIIREKLEILADFIRSEADVTDEMKTFTDSKPVMEKAWAVRSGLGWQGRNCLVINKELGSKFYIGGILTSTELEPVIETEIQSCGNCRKCIDSCPTMALEFPGILDAGKCIAYHTIENKDAIPVNIASRMKDRIYGCEICQDVCPWNIRNKSNFSTVIKSGRHTELTPEEWVNLTDEEFENMCSSTTIFRTGLNKLKENAGIVIKNRE